MAVVRDAVKCGHIHKKFAAVLCEEIIRPPSHTPCVVAYTKEANADLYASGFVCCIVSVSVSSNGYSLVFECPKIHQITTFYFISKELYMSQISSLPIHTFNEASLYSL